MTRARPARHAQQSGCPRRWRSAVLSGVDAGKTSLTERLLFAAGVIDEIGSGLPALTRGEGVLESGFDGYRPVRGAVPYRPRSGNDPLDREEYLLHVARRVAGNRDGG